MRSSAHRGFEDERFADNTARNVYERELYDLIAAWARGQSTDGALAALQEAGIPSGPVQSLGEVIASVYGTQRGLVSAGTHPTLGAVPLVEQPVRFGQTERGASEVPLLGEHTVEVLREVLDIDEVRLLNLRDSEAIEGVADDQ